MNPIINPWWFYLIDIVGKLEFVSIFVFVIGVIPLVIVGLVYALDRDCMLEKEQEQVKKFLKVLVVSIIISSIACAVIPSKGTVYAMMAAKQITPNNIEVVGGTIEDAVDYIFEKIDALDNEE